MTMHMKLSRWALILVLLAFVTWPSVVLLHKRGVGQSALDSAWNKGISIPDVAVESAWNERIYSKVKSNPEHRQNVAHACRVLVEILDAGDPALNALEDVSEIVTAETEEENFKLIDNDGTVTLKVNRLFGENVPLLVIALREGLSQHSAIHMANPQRFLQAGQLAKTRIDTVERLRKFVWDSTTRLNWIQRGRADFVFDRLGSEARVDYQVAIAKEEEPELN